MANIQNRFQFVIFEILCENFGPEWNIFFEILLRKYIANFVKPPQNIFSFRNLKPTTRDGKKQYVKNILQFIPR